jgi:hypothetical protein
MTKDRIQYNEDGSMVLRFKDKTYNVDDPTAGHYTDAYIAWNKRKDAYFARIRDLMKRSTELMDGVPKPHDKTNPDYAAVVESDEYQRTVLEMDEENARLKAEPWHIETLDWLYEWLYPLTEPELPAAISWPSWMVNEQLPQRILDHWRDNPPRSGPSTGSR